MCICDISHKLWCSYCIFTSFQASFQKSSLFRENLGIEHCQKVRELETTMAEAIDMQFNWHSNPTHQRVCISWKTTGLKAKIQKYQQFQRCALPPWLHASHVAPWRSLSVRFAKFAQAKAAEADAFSKCRCVFWMSCDACDHNRKTWNDEMFSKIKSTRHGCFTGKCRAKGLSLTSTTLLMPCPRKQCCP